MSGWAIDLGTTNTVVATWDAEKASPRCVAPPELRRTSEDDASILESDLVPSATELVPARSIADHVGRVPWMARRVFWGRWAFIGREALQRNEAGPSASFVPGFKRALAKAPLRTLARDGDRPISAREVARAFSRELLSAIERHAGARIRNPVITTPVDAYESYRLELQNIFLSLGTRNVRFVDEPVAAALGYGVGTSRESRVLVVDIGGGTTHVALVKLSPRTAREGQSEVVGKVGVQLGGDDVDRWLVEDLCARLEYDLAENGERFWYDLCVREACRVKEAVYFRDSATFHALPPEELRRFEARLGGRAGSYELTRKALGELLERRGLYQALRDCLVEVDRQGALAGCPLDSVEEVLMVGGSTLLPGVYSLVEERFGRERVRAWQPFEAVAYGAAAHAAGAFDHSDFIVHDYAFVTHDPKTHRPSYTTIVAAGTRFPTQSDHFKRQLVPTCTHGRPESTFKLVVCEVGKNRGLVRRFGFDESGVPHAIGAGETANDDAYVVKLNESSPTLGFLEPPHEPADRAPRLEVGFGVNHERWLVATVRDLKTGKVLLAEKPVVKVV